MVARPGLFITRRYIPAGQQWASLRVLICYSGMPTNDSIARKCRTGPHGVSLTSVLRKTLSTKGLLLEAHLKEVAK